jgi:DNA-binding MarR family transcriptional regulator
MMDERTAIPLDAETKVSERPDDHKTELRLWLRLLTCTTLIENQVRRRLRDQFNITLPRFDLLAQLDRAPNGMTLGELSQRMMVSNGNITGLVERLAEQGLIRRRPLPNDRRVQIVSLTPEGQRFFRSMARVNADWVGDIFAGLAPKDIEALMPLLAKTKQSARQALNNGDAS